MSSSTTARLPCFLVEWYGAQVSIERLERTTLLLSAPTAPVRLMMALAVPTEDTAFAVVAADSKGTVAQACRDIGMPAQRISAAVGTWPRVD
jgi:hypothetical protein